MSTRARALEKLALSMPGENQKFAQQQQQARQIQLQEQIKNIQPGTGTTGTAQALGAQQAQQAGQIQQQAAQQGQQQAQAVGQMGLAEQQRQQQQKGFSQQLAISQNQREIADKLAGLDNRLKTQLLDDQLNFKQNQAGQVLLNERQLADWAVTKAQSAEEFASYAQAAQQVYERELQMLETAHNKITQVLQQNYIKENTPLDRELKLKLAKQKRDLEAEIQKKQNKAANKATMFQSIGTIGGGIVGAYFGGPTGAAAGASLGGGLGTMAGSILG